MLRRARASSTAPSAAQISSVAHSAASAAVDPGGDPAQARRWLTTLGEDERLSLFAFSARPG
jgi:hypothetical protein